jgi:hypothetical protein
LLDVSWRKLLFVLRVKFEELRGSFEGALHARLADAMVYHLSAT